MLNIYLSLALMTVTFLIFYFHHIQMTSFMGERKIFNLSPKKSENVPKVNFGDILSFFLNTKETREVFTHFYLRLPLGQFFFRQFFASILSRYLRMLWLNVFWSRTLKDTEIFHSALQISSSNDVNLL